ncbi:hypothetical protein DFP93_13332 [Aneurinibacillus soli]|uniref:Signal transduction histidine-protein kinase ArlS n=2 Tax=Aneurinibacillus soli TaxID=1500254 RepID=A0A0U4NA46_9BACL|nr:HAMP domain-containing histidine kinase [Aneurinibacillus soli]PYE57172.1 hypothetical protein DFP93_13332 [Aneurinibacillus soli]BAU25972.1 Signal transduction histidine-protein kinase ArlS [Aneurinibacillus soli]
MKNLSLPIKYKLTIWSSMLLFALFLSYNLLQYVVISNWTLAQDTRTTTREMNQVKTYLFQKSNSSVLTKQMIYESKKTLEENNKPFQAIRIIDGNGKVLLLVSNISVDQIKPKKVKVAELYNFQSNERHFQIIRSPIKIDNAMGTIEVIRDIEFFKGLFQQVLNVMIIAGIISIILSWVGGMIISKQLLKPVKNILDAMKKIKKHGLHERVALYGQKDEISEIGRMFNEIMDQLEESFLQQKQFVEDASHELRTPISIIQGHLQLINRWGKYEPQVLNKSLNASLKELDKLSHLVSELLELSKAELEERNDQTEWINPIPIIENLIKNFRIVHNEFEFVVEVTENKEYLIQMQTKHLEQILTVLLDNAVKYSKENKWIKCSVRVTENQFLIEILDKGIGIPKEELPFVMNRFYRVNKARTRKEGGYGLGLSIAQRLIKKYNASILIASEINKGTSVTLQFPYKSSGYMRLDHDDN